MYMLPLPTKKELLELLNYDPSTGVFTRNKSNTRIKKKEITCKKSKGYKCIRINGVYYSAHRLAWKITYDEDPNVIDHINGIRDDNRISNLRNVSQVENMCNLHRLPKDNKSGILGVSWNAQTKHWKAQITINQKKYHLGYSKCKAVAGIIYMLAKQKRMS